MNTRNRLGVVLFVAGCVLILSEAINPSISIGNSWIYLGLVEMLVGGFMYAIQ